MRCAVVNALGEVVNVIMADPSDPAPGKCLLVELDDESPVDTRWLMVDGGFVEGPELIAQREAEAAAAIEEGLHLDD